MRWTLRRRRTEESAPQNTISISDSALITLFGGGALNGNIVVSEYSILGNSAFNRAIMLISGALAQLKLNSYMEDGSGQPKVVKSIFDNPDSLSLGGRQTPFEWKQTLFIHRILYGSAFAMKVKTSAGALVRLPLIHPSSVYTLPPEDPEYKKATPLGGKWFRVTYDDGTQKVLDANTIWEIPNVTLDGYVGIGLLTIARQSASTTLQGDRAANRVMSNGLSVSALITPEPGSQDITSDIPEIRRQLDLELTGPEKVGGYGLMNRELKVQQLSMNMKDAQFIEQREFQIEEVSRFTGVPPHLLMQTDKQTSWGTGVDEQNRGLSKFVLGPTAKGFEERASDLLANPRWVEFEFASLERPSPEKEIELLLKQTGKPFLTINEARKIRNLPPVPGGDILETTPVPMAEPEKEADPDADPNAEESK